MDAPTDKSNIVANKWVYEDDRFNLLVNSEHYGLCRNMYHIIQCAGRILKPDDEAVAAVVDADDRLSKHAFEEVEKVFRKYPKTLITHGSYIKMSKGRKTKISRPNPKHGNIRKLPWRSSHLKCCKWKIIKQAKKDWFMHKGEWLTAASDLALMFGCIEIAGLKRVRFISRAVYYWDDKGSAEKRFAERRCERIQRKK